MFLTESISEAASGKADRLPPHSPEAEQGVLGCCFTDPTCIDDCEVKFKPGSSVFYDLRNQTIYEAICAVRAEGTAVDIITVQQHLKNKKLLENVGGIAYVSALPDQVPSAANLSYYLAIVWEKYLLRKVIRFCTKAVAKLNDFEGDAYTLIGGIQSAFNELETDEGATSEAKQCAVGLVEDLQRRLENHAAGKRSGLTCGFSKLDYLTDGIQYGEQTIIGARPSIGKTALALNIMQRACLEDKIPTAFVTLEMGRDALMRRLCSSRANIPMDTMRTGAFSEAQHQAFFHFTKLLQASPVHVIDGVRGMNINQVAAEIRRVVRKHGVKLVLIDYLQKISPAGKHEKRTYEVGSVSQTLKSIAHETKTAFVTLAQLNREPERDKGRIPRLSDLADSAQIERDGDCIALLHRDRTESATDANLYIAKQRDGNVGVVPLRFNGQFCRFENPPIDNQD